MRKIIGCVKFRRIFISLIVGSVLGPAFVRAQDAALPDAPQQEIPSTGVGASQPQGGGSIVGTVVDRNGDVLQGAQITLSSPTVASRAVQSGNEGQFSFPGLPPDTYTLSVSAPGMNTYTSPAIALRAGEFHIVPAITLSVSSVATSVTVRDKEQESEEQVQIAVQQRVAGVIPNFYSSYDWNAPPMQAKQKFQLAFVPSSIRFHS